MEPKIQKVSRTRADQGCNFCGQLKDEYISGRCESGYCICKKCIIMAAHVMGLGVIIYPPNHKSPKKKR